MKRICLSAAFILAFLSPLSATTVQRLSFDDLVAKAQSIVVGQVIDSRTDWNDGHKLILTSYTIQAQESMKSNASPTVTVTTVGGKVGNTILHVSGMPVLEPGENVILFLEQSNSYTTVVGLNQKENSRYRTARSPTVSGKLCGFLPKSPKKRRNGRLSRNTSPKLRRKEDSKGRKANA